MLKTAWNRVTQWQDETYSSASIVSTGLQVSPAALVMIGLQHLFPERFKKVESEPELMDDRKPVERLEACELTMQDSYYEQMILDVNDDVYIIIRNLNPAVSLDEISFDEIAGWIIDNPVIAGRLEKMVQCEFGLCRDEDGCWK